MILLIIVLSLISTQEVKAEPCKPVAAPKLDECYNPGDDVSYFFASCIRGNFAKMERYMKEQQATCPPEKK